MLQGASSVQSALQQLQTILENTDVPAELVHSVAVDATTQPETMQIPGFREALALTLRAAGAKQSVKGAVRRLLQGDLAAARPLAIGMNLFLLLLRRAVPFARQFAAAAPPLQEERFRMLSQAILDTEQRVSQIARVVAAIVGPQAFAAAANRRATWPPHSVTRKSWTYWGEQIGLDGGTMPYIILAIVAVVILAAVCKSRSPLTVGVRSRRG